MQPESGEDPILYFDNAATSWPKPTEMIEAMIRYNGMIGGNPGRSGHHRSLDAGRIILEVREALAELFGCDALRMVFTKNATEALNISLSGLLHAGDHVITSITVYGPPGAASRTAVVSFNIAGVSPSDAALEFDERFRIMCRPGLHCAPAAHRTIGTFSRGTIRFGFGYFNMEEEISLALEAIRFMI
jgi:selenocysteine lyase/cysteine desulfurase